MFEALRAPSLDARPFGREAPRDPSIFMLMRERPELSAHVLMTPMQKATAAAAVVAALGLLVFWPTGSLVSLSIAATAFFLAAFAFRVALAMVGLRSDLAQTAACAPAEDILPTVTILLPVHDEAEGLPILADAIARIDYPPGKLDIKLLLEASDQATIAEARRLKLDSVFDCLIVPDEGPKTKPKACNYGLAAAQGDLVVIYDAEDAPESDQLRKAAAVFAHGDARLACLQARLNFYNADESFLTRLFALEYALWFDLFLPALERLRLPIPLGGTSNIFRAEILRTVGGWDPFNVTEDADLGLRLARLGYRTAVLDLTTYEEANCRLGNWVRQRSRWMKGYMQTWLVHMRAPSAFRRAVGWRGFLALQLFVAGNVLSALLSPLLAALALAWAIFGGGPTAPAIETINVAALIAGNLIFVFLAAIAPSRRGWTRLVPYAVFAPVYWLLASFAAWRAFFQLFTEPSRWEKTAHAVSLAAKRKRVLALARFE